MATNNGSQQNKQRIERLQHRLHSLQTNMETTKNNKSAAASSLVVNLRERFQSQQSQTSAKFENISDLLERVNKQLET